jgi:spore coat polysaccharide biosynthesis predicted glycosyltransferase SpsG/CMP-N-acetylneuraminic acid synthetase
VRLLGGIPLVARTVSTAAAASPGRVVVVTDDDEIAEISVAYGAKVVREPKTTGKATLDEVMVRTIPDLKEFGATEEEYLLTMQATCPFVKAERIHEAMALFESGAGSVITCVDDRHLGWVLDEAGKPQPDYKARLNRQALPAHFRESGAIIGARISEIIARGTRIVEPIRLLELSPTEALDIDTWADWAAAEHWATRRTILLRTDAAKELGMGHVYRTLALAYALARHELRIVLSKNMPLGISFFEEYPFEVVEIDNDAELPELAVDLGADLVVLDKLDTDAGLVQKLTETCKVVTFEDLGSGAEHADLLVADLYDNPHVASDRQLTGPENSILAPSFESLPRKSEFADNVEEVLVLFGGTDPSGLAEKGLRALESIGFEGKVTLIRGLGAAELKAADYRLKIELLSNVKNIPAIMARADIALSSAGRTITELASIGVPTLCLAQNHKELTHTHTSTENGVVMLGLGELVTVETLANHIKALIEDTQLRKRLHDRALAATAGRSNAQIVDRIMKKVGL